MTISPSTSHPNAARKHQAPPLRRVVAQLPGYVAGRRPSNARIAPLASNESHCDPLPSVLEVLKESSHHINRYPDIAAEKLRQRIAASLGVYAEEVTVGPGSVGVLQQIIAATCDPGDEVVFAWRSFEAYPILITIAGAVPVPVPLNASDGHDLQAMLSAITDRTRMMLICSPNNPTGVAVDHDALARFLTAVPPHVLVLIDEAYVEYVDAPNRLDALLLFRSYSNVCILRTFSKAYGLAGLRVGYAVAHTDLAEGLRRVALPFAVSALAQQAAIASLDAASEIQDRVTTLTLERARVLDALQDAGWNLPESQGNFVWIPANGQLEEALVGAFDRAGILVRAFTGDGLRITLADRATNDRVLVVLRNRSDFPST